MISDLLKDLNVDCNFTNDIQESKYVEGSYSIITNLFKNYEYTPKRNAYDIEYSLDSIKSKII